MDFRCWWNSFEGNLAAIRRPSGYRLRASSIGRFADAAAVNSRKQCVRSTVNKLESNVSRRLVKQVVGADPGAVHWLVSPGIPPQRRGLASGKGCDERRNGEHAMAVVASARGESGNDRVSKTRQKAAAGARVTERVLTEKSCGDIASAGGRNRDVVVGREPPAISRCTAAPFRRSAIRLLDSTR